MSLAFMLVPPLFISCAIAGVCFMVTRSIRRTISSAAWLTSLLPITVTLVLYPTLPFYDAFYHVVANTLVMFSYLLLWVFLAKEIFHNRDIPEESTRIRRYVLNAVFSFALLGYSLSVLFFSVLMVHNRSYPWNPASQHVERMDIPPK